MGGRRFCITANYYKMNVLTESVALRGGDMYTPSSTQTVVVQHTRLTVEREMPKDHFIWSLCCFLYSPFCCLGLVALVHSIKARDKKMVGDIEAAQSYGLTARTLNIISTVIFCLSVLILVIVVTVISRQGAHFVHSMTSYGRGYSDRGFHKG